MAKVPLPERGQPLDVTYIYQLADTINDLSNRVSSSTSSLTTIDTVSAGKQNIKTSECKIIAGYVDIVSNGSVLASSEKSFAYDFTSDFKYSPIVTATAVNTGNTPAGQNVSVVLKNITTSRVEGVVKFGSSGDLSLAVNLIIVGVPN